MAHFDFLVTGGAGFIGSNIVRELVSLGKEVRVLDDFSTGRYENLDDVRSDIELIEGDIRDSETVKSATCNVSVVLHQAALPSVQRSIEDPYATNAVNVTGTLHVLQSALENGVRKVVYASSSSLYGDSEVLPKVETMTPSPLSPYAVSKLTGERYCSVYSRIHGLETVALRYFNVFGPGQDPSSHYSAVIPRFIHRVLGGESPVIFGDGTQSRDFTYIDNVVQANLAAAETRTEGHLAMNCGCGVRIPLNSVAQEIIDRIDPSVSIQYGKPRQGDVKHSLADIRLAREAIGYEPQTGFEAGLERTIEHFQKRMSGNITVRP